MSFVHIVRLDCDGTNDGWSEACVGEYRGGSTAHELRMGASDNGWRVGMNSVDVCPSCVKEMGGRRDEPNKD